jgi:iron complex transport system permease protein
MTDDDRIDAATDHDRIDSGTADRPVADGSGSTSEPDGGFAIDPVDVDESGVPMPAYVGGGDEADLETRTSVLQAYRERGRRKVAFLVATVAIVLVVGSYALVTGPIAVAVTDLPAIILGQQDGVGSVVIWNLRLPRIVAALGAGAGLAVAGATLQSVLRNPLASPYTLGISQAAAFGAAFSIVFLGAGTTKDEGTIVQLANPYLTSTSAFVMALTATGAIYAIAKYKRASPETLILAGIALSSLATAGTTVLEYFATNVQLAALIFWKFGDVGGATWGFNAILWVVVILSTAYFTWNAWAYTVLNAGDETAESLGVNVERVRLAGMVVASFVTATVVGMFGVIGFVGLVVPHIVRRSIGGDERFLIPASTLAGAALLLASDTVARTIISPIVFPVGIVTSFVGVPLFLYLILRGREYW